jgi:hypothetical protein
MDAKLLRTCTSENVFHFSQSWFRLGAGLEIQFGNYFSSEFLRHYCICIQLPVLLLKRPKLS